VYELIAELRLNWFLALTFRLNQNRQTNPIQRTIKRMTRIEYQNLCPLVTSLRPISAKGSEREKTIFLQFRWIDLFDRSIVSVYRLTIIGIHLSDNKYSSNCCLECYSIVIFTNIVYPWFFIWCYESPTIINYGFNLFIKCLKKIEKHWKRFYQVHT